MNLFSKESGLEVLSQQFPKIKAFPLAKSTEGDSSGNLIDVGLATSEITPSSGLAGNIALIQRGQITFQEKVFRVASAGATAAIIYNNAPGLFQGSFTDESPIPAISISKEDGELLKGMLSQGQVKVSVTVKREDKETRNVIAEKPSSSERVLILGGHFDTVPEVPGANDNGSGVAVLLAIADQISKESLPFKVQFIFFGSEELGLYGSQHYVTSLSEEDRKNVIAMLNFDALGSGNNLEIIGDKSLVNKVVSLAKERNINIRVLERLQVGSSDHANFQAVGIPTIFFAASDFSRIHTPQDTLDFVEPQRLREATELGISLLAALAKESL